MSTSKEIRSEYLLDIYKKSRVVNHLKNGYAHFYNGFKDMTIDTIYPIEWMERLRELCAEDNINKVGCEPKRLGRV